MVYFTLVMVRCFLEFTLLRPRNHNGFTLCNCLTYYMRISKNNYLDFFSTSLSETSTQMTDSRLSSEPPIQKYSIDFNTLSLIHAIFHPTTRHVTPHEPGITRHPSGFIFMSLI